MHINLLTACPPRASAEVLQLAVMEAVVSITGYCYAVDLGEGVQPRRHYVGPDLACACEILEACPAVRSVQEYLRAGGQPAPQPPPGYYPVRPARCPVCGDGTVLDARLSSKRRGSGWRCVSGGSAHYWDTMGKALAEKFAANPWLFPPVVLREGQQCFAWDGVLESDQMLYPGILRTEVITTI